LYQSEYTHYYRYFYKIGFSWKLEFCFFITKSTNIVVNHILKKIDKYIDEKGNGDDMEARARNNIHSIIIQCLFSLYVNRNPLGRTHIADLFLLVSMLRLFWFNRKLLCLMLPPSSQIINPRLKPFLP